MLLQVVDGYVVYNGLENKRVTITDGDWHQISLDLTDSSTKLSVDDIGVSDNSSKPVDFLDLKVISGIVIAENYEGV